MTMRNSQSKSHKNTPGKTDNAKGESHGDELIKIGVVTKAHGIKGELSLKFLAESPDLLHGEVLIGKTERDAKAAEIIKVRNHHGNMLLTLKTVTDRSQAEAMRGASLFIPASKLPELNDDEVYLYQLQGLAVITRAEDGSESYLGTIEAIETPAGQELWHIRTKNDKEVIFPAVEEFVLSIDLDQKQAVIAPPPGLLEIYL